VIYVAGGKNRRQKVNVASKVLKVGDGGRKGRAKCYLIIAHSAVE
jgi:hypothetical protein